MKKCVIYKALIILIAEFTTYMNYCKTLKFDEKPNYRFLKNIFKQILLSYPGKHEFDWNIKVSVKIKFVD